jgi:methyl-accepting chemotaxis protein
MAPLAAAVVESRSQLERLWLDKKLSSVTRSDGSVLDEALMIEASAPILGARGFEGALLIGQMLNRYSVAPAGKSGLQIPVISEIRQYIYRGNDPEGGAVVALGDTIIASTIRGPSGGTPLLGAARDSGKTEEVIESRPRRYRVGWHAINSLDGSPMGAIGVVVPLGSGGVSEARLILVVAVITVLAAATLGFIAGRSMAARVNSLTDAVGRMSLGELSTTVRDQDGLNGSQGSLRRDEITRLAEQLDHMRESFRQAIERIRKR